MSKLKERVDNLERWVKDISAIQNQLVEEEGYEVKWKVPAYSNVYLIKTEEKEDE